MEIPFYAIHTLDQTFYPCLSSKIGSLKVFRNVIKHKFG